MAGEYGVILREAQGLCEARGWGSMRTFAVSGAVSRVAFAAVPGNLLLGFFGGREALLGRMRRAVSDAAPEFGSL
jgi:hypothetical protein